MDNSDYKLDKKKGIKANVLTILLIIGIIATAYTIVSPIRDFFNWKKTWGTVELNGTFPNETWKNADEDDFQWIVGEWYFPSLGNFTSRFKIEDGKLFKQNEDDDYRYKFKTEWYEAKVYISNSGLIRLEYVNNDDWDIDFYDKVKKYDCYEHQRYINSQGIVEAGKKRLMLNKNHCKVSNGIYNCDE